ncbi:hypothetical protein NLI96_g8949 [Meripilus lineatus]|uniref:Uncharacterized protein n=1 Tax=Meripilus lineatus TaxID=2056292 RepID=A0AAD5UY32_9APHY|nr:hypothetical protein NLI96_g8949 [Physisporinus lineatus]
MGQCFRGMVAFCAPPGPTETTIAKSTPSSVAIVSHTHPSPICDYPVHQNPREFLPPARTPSNPPCSFETPPITEERGNYPSDTYFLQPPEATTIIIYDANDDPKKILNHPVRIAVVVMPRGQGAPTHMGGPTWSPIAWKIFEFGNGAGFTGIIPWSPNVAIGTTVSDVRTDWLPIQVGHYGVYEQQGNHPAWSAATFPLDASQRNQVGAVNSHCVPHRFTLGLVQGETFEKLIDLGIFRPGERAILGPPVMLQFFSVSRECRAGEPLPEDERRQALLKDPGPQGRSRPIDLTRRSPQNLMFRLFSNSLGGTVVEQVDLENSDRMARTYD